MGLNRVGRVEKTRVANKASTVQTAKPTGSLLLKVEGTDTDGLLEGNHGIPVR